MSDMYVYMYAICMLKLYWDFVFDIDGAHLIVVSCKARCPNSICVFDDDDNDKNTRKISFYIVCLPPHCNVHLCLLSFSFAVN